MMESYSICNFGNSVYNIHEGCSLDFGALSVVMHQLDQHVMFLCGVTRISIIKL